MPNLQEEALLPGLRPRAQVLEAALREELIDPGGRPCVCIGTHLRAGPRLYQRRFLQPTTLRNLVFIASAALQSNKPRIN